ncbi:MAG: aminopeptidase P family protein, partial [Muribaculaceae bacterium]|nr:aminopeptidase P family protein [Muribaculaceae bacterium]
IDAVIVPQTDPHQSEYRARHWQAIRFLTGFTGSAGTLVVTAEDALLWTDSRYFIQAADQLAGTGVELMKMGLPGTPGIEEWLAAHLSAGAVVGLDGMLFTAARANELRGWFAARGLKLDSAFDPLGDIWAERPPLPKDKIFIHEEKYAGESAANKIKGVLAKSEESQASSALLTALDEIAWTLNIRCRDVRCNPVATAYLYVATEGSILFIDPDKVDAASAEYLHGQGVECRPYDGIADFLLSLPSTARVLVNEGGISATLAALLGKRAVYGASPVAMAKACKNAVQIEGIRQAMLRDGVAMVRSLMEIEQAMASGNPLTEMGVDAILRRRRGEQALFFDESFGTIAGYGPHGAIVHYEATADTDATLEPHGLLLIDSGAQYLDGTTDITRTISLGEPTDDERRDFTLVMKGHIALAQAVFPAGTSGTQLDVLARQFLWKDGLTYLHGTGHGVGHFLNVHEGPHQIRLNYVPAPLTEGMVTSNEPGLYREGVHGIRCENLMLCVPAMDTEFGHFLQFETLTLCPFDLGLFDLGIMTPDEITWVDAYHAEVREKLTPLLTDEEAAWLAEKTKKLTSKN